MKDAHVKELVRKAYHRDQKSKRQIAREFGIHRDTVSRLLVGDTNEAPQLQRQTWTAPVMGPFLSVIET